MSLQIQGTNTRTGQTASALQNSTANLQANPGDSIQYAILRGPVNQSGTFQASSTGTDPWRYVTSIQTDGSGNWQSNPEVWTPETATDSYYRVTWP